MKESSREEGSSFQRHTRSIRAREGKMNLLAVLQGDGLKHQVFKFVYLCNMRSKANQDCRSQTSSTQVAWTVQEGPVSACYHLFKSAKNIVKKPIHTSGKVVRGKV